MKKTMKSSVLVCRCILYFSCDWPYGSRLETHWKFFAMISNDMNELYAKNQPIWLCQCFATAHFQWEDFSFCSNKWAKIWGKIEHIWRVTKQIENRTPRHPRGTASIWPWNILPWYQNHLARVLTCPKLPRKWAQERNFASWSKVLKFQFCSRKKYSEKQNIIYNRVK